MKDKNSSLWLCTIILSIGLMSAGYFIGDGFLKARRVQFVTVKGLAEKDVVADLGIYPLVFSATGPKLNEAHEKIEEDKQKVLSFLKEQGFADEEIEIGQLRVIDRVAQNYEKITENNRYTLEAVITLYSKHVDKLKKISNMTGALVKQGIILTAYEGPRLLFTNVNEIKSDLVAEATKAARKSAEQFARDSGSKVGSIKAANQGALIVKDKGSEYTYDMSLNKTARIVSTITYFLKD